MKATVSDLPNVQVRCGTCDRLLAIASAGSVVNIVCPRCKAATLKQVRPLDKPAPPVVR